MKMNFFTNRIVTAFMALGCFAITALHSNTIDAQTISTIAGIDGQYGYSGDGGPATAALLGQPWGVVVDAAGNKYIADSKNRIRKVDVAGNITTVAGNGTEGYSGDGGAATDAQIGIPWGVAIDAAGNIYIADGDNYCVRKVSASGIISTVVGNGTSGSSGDGGQATAAQATPYNVTVDAAGNLYVVDLYNIRKVTSDGVINTVAGNGTAAYSGDGGAATDAALNTPSSVAIDASGNMYIADYYNNCVRKVNASGIISTVAGNAALGGYSGNGGPATDASVGFPISVAVDASGNLYIGLNAAAIVCEVNAAGIIYAIAGTPNQVGFTGDDGPATDATLWGPDGIAFDAAGNMFIADNNNCAIRRVTPVTCDSVAPGAIVNSGSKTFCGTGSDTLALINATAGNGITYQWQSSADGVNYTNAGADTIQYATGTLTSTMYYKVIVTCTTASITDTTAADTIIVNPVVTPTVSVTASPGTTVTIGQTVTYTATVTNGGVVPSYQWRKNGVNIPGAAAATYATSTLADNDIITCLVYSTAPCASPDSANSNGLTMNISSSVASVNGNIDGIQTYPNPNNGSFTITGNINNSKEAKIEVLNMIGQVVYTTAIPVQNGAMNKQIQLSNDNANGIYILRITTDSGSSVMRFVVER